MMLRLVLDQRLVRNPSPNQPFIFYIDFRTLAYGKEDLCLITSFRFGKVNLDHREEDYSKFRKRVFPKIGNLNGEHLLTLVNKDVKFNKLDDGDAVRVCLLLALDFVFIDYRKYHFEKLASNPKYEANYVLYGFVFPFKIWALETFSNSTHWWRKDANVTPCVLRSATKGSSNSKSVHTRVRIEVRHEVHVRTEVSRVVNKEEVHVRAVDKEDVRTRAVDEEDTQERVVLAKTVKAQEQMIVDLQRHLFSLEEITKQLKTGPSDVDHLDKVTSFA
nr:hypothetical protein [Tanacetum cinerariifolium]